jgi:hypothetical protein
VIVSFPDGTKVAASSLACRREDDPERDFGLYMDPAWAPTWDAELIDWPDYGVPSDSEIATSQIVHAFERAKRGENVEVGCLGGLGRTGTVLACMAVLAGVPAGEAVEWVRNHYDLDAVEIPEQEEWVLQFSAWTA